MAVIMILRDTDQKTRESSFYFLQWTFYLTLEFDFIALVLPSREVDECKWK